MKKLFSFIVILLLAPQSAVAKEKDPAVSRVFLDGACKGFVRNTGEGKAEAFGLDAIVAAVASAAVKEVVIMGQKWFNDFKDGYKGQDKAENVDLFYCGYENGILGIKENIVYQRSSLYNRDSNGDGVNHIKIVSKITMYNSIGGKPGFFTITPDSISYKNPIAKRGNTKDITIVYNFSFFDKEGKEVKASSGPILFKSVSVGTEIDGLEKIYGRKAIIPLPYILAVSKIGDKNDKYTVETPFKISAEVVEVSAGKGEELLGNIASSIGGSIEKEQDAIVNLILSKILKDISDESSADSNLNPQNNKNKDGKKFDSASGLNLN